MAATRKDLGELVQALSSKVVRLRRNKRRALRVASPGGSAPYASRTRGGWTPGRVLGVIVVLGLVLFWIWIFAGGPARENRDYLSDRRWVGEAERTCSETVAAIGRLPRASTTASAEGRADVLDRATDSLDTMIARLARPVPDNDADARLVRAWLTDLRAYVANRREYAADLRRDPGARLLVDEKFGDPIDTVIGTFAEVNDMPTCAPPDDVA